MKVLGTVWCLLELWKEGSQGVWLPGFGKANLDDKPKAKEAPSVKTGSIEPWLARRLPVVDWEIDTRDESDETETISFLMDTGSVITMGRSETKNLAENVCMSDVGFSGVGSSGSAKETETLRMKVGEDWVDVGVHFMEPISKGLEAIVGLDNKPHSVDLKEGIIFPYICKRIRREMDKFQVIRT